MLNFLLLILAGIGITNIVVNATILDIPRDFLTEHSSFLKKLLSCMMCSGFWVGFFLGIFLGFNPILIGASISLLSHAYSYFSDYMDVSIALSAQRLDKVEFNDEE